MDDSKKLKEILDYHNNLYYTMDKPEISDEEYDSIKKKYIELEGEYDYVPGDLSSDFENVNHTYPVRSLDKVNSEDEVRKEIERLLPVVIQPKIDGLTVIGYPGTVTGAGKFVTRGNGKVGEKITHTAMKIIDINKVNKIDYPVRMEAYMPISVFNKLNEERAKSGEEPLKNPRNAAAGMLRHKDADKVQGVHYLAYNIMGSAKSETDQLKQLIYDGFNVIPSWVFDNVDEAVKFILNFKSEHSIDFEIDGMVIKSNLPDSLAIFGETGHHPKNAVAYKFPPEGKWTTIKYIEWQIGKTGKATPVATLEPVDIEGSTISRVTLHNKSIMDTLGVTTNCEVFVIKANGVIPAIVKVRNSSGDSINEPTKCPSCGSVLEKVNDQLFCNNLECKEKMVARIAHIGGRDALDIEGLSDETAAKIVDKFDPKSPFDIFKLTTEDIITLPGFAKKSAENLYNAIQRTRTITPLPKFLYAAGVPMVGRSATADIANVFGCYSEFVKDMINDFAKTKEIEGIGPILIDNMRKYKHLWTELSQYILPVQIEKIAAPEKVLTFVITGTLEKPRSYYENLIKKAGHKTSGSVSKATNYVLAGVEAGSKLTKAMDLGFDKEGRILHTEEDLLKVLG